jgi:hypothetical protein
MTPRKYLGNPNAEPTGHKARQTRAAEAATTPNTATPLDEIFGKTRTYSQLPPTPAPTRGKGQSGL